MLIGLSTLALGSSGLMVSGAFGFGSDDSDGGNWSQIDDTDGTDDSGEVAVQAVVDPDGGNRLEHLDLEGIDPVDTNVVEADEDGLLRNIALESINYDAVTSIGRVGRVTGPERPVFMIANVGGVNRDSLDGVPVEIRLGVYDHSDPTEGGRLDFGDGLQFPYAINGRNVSGDDLSQGESVLLEPEEILCVGIRIDSSAASGFGNIERFAITIENGSEE